LTVTAAPTPAPTPVQTIPDSRVDRAFARWARWMVRFRWVVVGAWVIAVLVIPSALPTLSSATKGSNADFLPKDSPSLRAAKLAAPFQSSNALSTILVGGRDGQPLTAADNAALDQIRATVAKNPKVLDVRDQGLSADGQARRLLVEFNQRVGFNSGSKIFDGLRSDVTRASVPAGLSVHFGGEFAANVDKQKDQQNQQKATEFGSIIFIIVLLLIVFRSALAPLITLLPAALSLVIAGPLIAEASKLGIQVSELTQILLVVIVLGAGTDYGLFLIFRVREEIANGHEPRDAVTVALSRVGETITFSAACVIFALASLFFADFGFYRGLGPGLAIGIAVVLVAGLTLMPALLAIFGRAAFWPRQPVLGKEQTGAWGRAASRVVEHPKRTLAIGVLVFGGLALGMLGYASAGFGANVSPAGSDSAKAEQILDAHFPIAVRNPTNIVFKLGQSAWTNPTPVAQAQAALARQKPFTSVLGGLAPQGKPLPTQLITELYPKLGPPQKLAFNAKPPAGVSAQEFAAYQATSQFISRDGKTIQYYAALRAGDPNTTEALRATPAIREAVDQVAAQIGATDHGVAGQATASYDVNKTATGDLKKIIPIVLLVIGMLLAILLRSLIAPIYLIASVGLSYLASLGFAIIVFVWAGGEPGLNFVLPFFMFVFLMALGSDYNILVMTRIREEAQRRPLREAVRHAVAATGGTVTSAGLVLAGTFGVLTATGDGQVREIGLGLAAGILLDTFLVRTLLLPSIVVLIGRWNWWPSKLSKLPEPPESAAETRSPVPETA
jgi:putative drug exporter of the RND superfamily